MAVSDDGTGPAEGTDEGGNPIDARTLRPPRMLDEDTLDELASRIATFPEPVASLAVGIEVARADGDSTGVRKRLFELAAGIVRYGVSIGLAALSDKLGGSTAPRPIAETLGRAARLSDGQWCELLRSVASSLKSLDKDMAVALAFGSQKPLAELVTARNDFIHRGGSGDNALDRLMAFLETTTALLSMPVRVVTSVNPPAFENRVGVPVRAGVWRKTQTQVPEGVEVGSVYLFRKAHADRQWLLLNPLLPFVDKRLLLLDAPHAPGKAWRCSDPETGEHREHAPVDKAIRAIVGVDPNAARELTDRPALVGRAPVRKILSRAAEEASGGTIRVVVLTGSFGVGRTRHAQNVAEHAAGYGFGRVVEATCSAERRSPLRPLRMAFENARGLEAVREAIERALSADSALARSGIEAWLEAIEEALVAASLVEPTVLVVDDAQWADEHTLSILRSLTERAMRKAQGKLLVVATVRDEPNPSLALRRFIGQAELGGGAARMALEPLLDEESANLVQGVAPVAKELEQAVVRGAGGVPFFLVQPLMVWNETGTLIWRDGAWRPKDDSILHTAVPGVRDLLRARLGSFFDPGSEAERAAQHVLACVALYGSGLPIDNLVTATETAGTNAMAAEKALELLVESGLLVVRGERHEHGFAQEIVRQAVLEDMKPRPWFRRIHRALLDAVANSEQAAAEMAFLAAGYDVLGVKDEAVTWMRRAIATALAVGTFEQAVEFGERLSKIGRSAAERVRGELSVVDALVRAGNALDARSRLEMIQLDSVEDRAVHLEARILTLSLAAILRHLPVDHDPSLVADADTHDASALRIEARLATARFVRGRRGLGLVEEAIKLAADAPKDLYCRSLLLRLELLSEVEAGDHLRMQRAAEAVHEIAHEIGSAWVELEADNNLAVARSNTGDFQEAIKLFESIAQRAKKLGFGTLHRSVLINIATTHLRAGDPERAAGAAKSAADAARSAGDAELLGGSQSVRADALLRIGNLGGARESIDEAVEIALGGRDYRATLALLRRVEVLEKLGEDALAAQDAELAGAIAEEGGNVDHATRAALWLALHACRAHVPEADTRLQQTVAGAEKVSSQLRVPTKRLLEEAQRLAGTR